jgi:hypothetical protein
MECGQPMNLTVADILAGAEAIKNAVYKGYAFQLTDQESKKIASPKSKKRLNRSS